VNEVLESVGAHKLPQIASTTRSIARASFRTRSWPGRASRSPVGLAHDGRGIDLLLQALHDQLGTDLHHCVLHLPPRAGRARAQLFEAGAVLAERQVDDGSIEVEVSLRRPRSRANLPWKRASNFHPPLRLVRLPDRSYNHRFATMRAPPASVTHTDLQ